MANLCFLFVHYGPFDSSKWTSTTLSDEFTPELIIGTPNPDLSGLTDVYQVFYKVGKVLFVNLSFTGSNIASWQKLIEFTDLIGDFGTSNYSFLLTNRSNIYLTIANDGVTGKLTINSSQAINQSISTNGIIILK